MSWFLGIDQSYSGMAMVLTDGDTVIDYLRSYPVAKFGNGVERLVAIQKDVVAFLAGEGYKPEVVCMEGYAAGAKFGREKAGELGATVKMGLWHLDYAEPVIVSPLSVKKFATGKGKASKAEILLAVYKKWNITYSNDNLADAFVLAKIAQAVSSKPEHLLAYEREVVAKLR